MAAKRGGATERGLFASGCQCIVCPHCQTGKTGELSEFLSAYYLCAKANLPSVSQNSPSLPQNSESFLFRNSTLETLFRPFPKSACDSPLPVQCQCQWSVCHRTVIPVAIQMSSPLFAYRALPLVQTCPIASVTVRECLSSEVAGSEPIPKNQI